MPHTTCVLVNAFNILRTVSTTELTNFRLTTQCMLKGKRENNRQQSFYQHHSLVAGESSCLFVELTACLCLKGEVKLFTFLHLIRWRIYPLQAQSYTVSHTDHRIYHSLLKELFSIANGLSCHIHKPGDYLRPQSNLPSQSTVGEGLSLASRGQQSTGTLLVPW